MGIIGPPAAWAQWNLARPRDAGISQDIGPALDAAVAAGDYDGLHGLLVIRNGHLAFERYLAGRDENWGHGLGVVEHGPHLPHDLRSVTKSVVGLLYGIALNAGLVPATTARLVDVLPGERDLLGDPLKRRITVGHVLSMRMGLSWAEDLAYANPENSERRMERAPDRIRHVLSLPMADPPGRRWVYSGGATVLLGHLVERGTGMRLEDFAEQVLFAPLGIADAGWARWADGGAAASSGLRMSARSLARIGQMMLDKGLWNGRRVVAASWVAASLKPRAFAEPGLRYGYQWWLGRLAANGKPWFAAYGNGGQRLIGIPSLRMAVVIFAGNYNAADQWKMPARLMARIVMPAVL
jgi:CubicO group peptidase (beta-lactamase class C family)